MKNLFIFFILFSTLLVFSCFAQSKGLKVEIQLTKYAKQNVTTEITRLACEITDSLRLKGIHSDSAKVQLAAKRRFLKGMTVNQTLELITPESKEWLKTFYNNYRPKEWPDFENFVHQNGSKTFREINELRKLKNKASFSTSKTLLRGEPVSIPDMSVYGKTSVLVREYMYGDQQRNIVSTPLQSIYLRGRYQPELPPHYPDYENVKCDDCCGPAAGQSILEWFNVPVKTSHGTVLTTDWDIQKRLSYLMETEDGRDYTYPGDLADVLSREEFLTDKGFCFKGRGGTLLDLHYMLSCGTPIIVLLAWDSYLHYVTIYGYQRLLYEPNQWDIANSTYRDDNRLLSDWYFENANFEVDVLIEFGGLEGGMLFSYCPTGDEVNWDYELWINPFDPLFSGDVNNGWINAYNENFIKQYAQNSSEYGMPLNFIATDYYPPFSFSPIILVHSGGLQVQLNPQYNGHIISGRFPSQTEDANNSVNRNVNLRVHIDRNFLDSQKGVYVGWQVLDESGGTINYEESRPFLTMIDSSLTAHNSVNYVFRYDKPYTTNQKRIDFILHEGFRKTSWVLSGCTHDADNDAICDEFDTDANGDGIEDLQIGLTAMEQFGQFMKSDEWKELPVESCANNPRDCMTTDIFKKLHGEYVKMIVSNGVIISAEQSARMLMGLIVQKNQMLKSISTIPK